MVPLPSSVPVPQMLILKTKNYTVVLLSYFIATSLNGRGGGTLLSRSFIDNCLHLTMHSTDSSFVFVFFNVSSRLKMISFTMRLAYNKQKRSKVTASCNFERSQVPAPHVRAHRTPFFLFSPQAMNVNVVSSRVFFFLFFPSVCDDHMTMVLSSGFKVSRCF